MEVIRNEYNNDVIGYNNSNVNYFTFENINVINEKLLSVLPHSVLPHLGCALEFGMGDICLEEDGDIFKFYVIDRTKKFDYEEFDNIKDAINKLIFYYVDNYDIDKELLKNIFFETLGISKSR